VVNKAANKLRPTNVILNVEETKNELLRGLRNLMLQSNAQKEGNIGKKR